MAVGLAQVVVRLLGVRVRVGTTVLVGTLTLAVPLHPFMLSVMVTV